MPSLAGRLLYNFAAEPVRPFWARGKDVLDFANGRYWVRGRLRQSAADALTAAGFTFGRASQASYWTASGLLAFAAAGQPRLDCDPAAGTPRGLLLEGAKTIRITQPEAIDNAYWTKNNGTLVDANQDVAPDGATTADRVRPPSGTSSTYGVQRSGIGVTDGSRYVASAFAKAGGVNWTIFAFFYSGVLNGNWFNLQAGTVGGAVNGAVGSSRNVGNGIRRIATAKTITGVGSTTLQVAPSPSDGQSAFTGDAVKYFDLWGVEVELAGDRSFPTSYAAGTARAADSLSRPIPAGPFTRHVGFTAPPGAGTCVMLQMDDGSEANRVRLYRDSSRNVRLVVTVAGTETVNLNLGAVADESFNRVALQFDGSTFRAVVNANPVVQSASSAMPPVTTERLGSSATAGDELCAWLAEFATYGNLAEGGLREASRVVPAWWLTDASNQPADIYLDRVNGRYGAFGKVYPTLAALMTGLGATVYADDDWTIPWTDAALTVVREGMAGDAKSAGHNYTLVQVDSGGANYSKLEQTSSLNSLYGQTFFGAPQFFVDTAVMRKFDTVSHAVTFKSNDFGIAYNGGNLQTDTAGTVPAVTTLRVGNSIARDRANDDGELWKLAIFRSPRASSELEALSNPRYAFIVAGDSYMDGSLTAGVPMSIARLVRRTVRNLAVGGSTLAQQVTVASSLIPAWPGSIFLHWDGKSNGYGATLQDDLDNYQAMADACDLAGCPYVFFTPVSSFFDTDAPTVTRQKAITAALPGLFPGHVVNATTFYSTRGDGSANDNLDIQNSLIPRSKFQVGNEAHMKITAHDDITLNGLMPLIAANGWLAAE